MSYALFALGLIFWAFAALNLFASGFTLPIGVTALVAVIGTLFLVGGAIVHAVRGSRK